MRKIKQDSPCFGCPYRKAFCHEDDNCEKEKRGEAGYPTFKRRMEEERLKREKRAITNNEFYDVRKQSTIRALQGK